MKNSLSSFLVGLLISSSAWATSLEVSDQASSSSQSLTTKFNTGTPSVYDVDVTYNSSVAKTTDVTTNVTDNSKTTDLYLNLTYHLESGFDTGVGVASH